MDTKGLNSANVAGAAARSPPTAAASLVGRPRRLTNAMLSRSTDRSGVFRRHLPWPETSGSTKACFFPVGCGAGGGVNPQRVGRGAFQCGVGRTAAGHAFPISDPIGQRSASERSGATSRNRAGSRGRVRQDGERVVCGTGFSHQLQEPPDAIPDLQSEFAPQRMPSPPPFPLRWHRESSGRVRAGPSRQTHFSAGSDIELLCSTPDR